MLQRSAKGVIAVLVLLCPVLCHSGLAVEECECCPVSSPQPDSTSQEPCFCTSAVPNKSASEAAVAMSDYAWQAVCLAVHSVNELAPDALKAVALLGRPASCNNPSPDLILPLLI